MNSVAISRDSFAFRNSKAIVSSFHCYPRPASRPASFELSAEIEHCFAIKMVRRQRQNRQNGAKAAADSEDQQEVPRYTRLRCLHCE